MESTLSYSELNQYLDETPTLEDPRPDAKPWWTGLGADPPRPLDEAPAPAEVLLRLDDIAGDELARLFEPYHGPQLVRLMLDALYPADDD